MSLADENFDRPLTEPELDYAFLAEFARADPMGTLTTVGASFTQLATPTLPASSWLYIAGRIRAPEGHPPVTVTITFEGPTPDSPQLRTSLELVTQATNPYRGRVGLLFTVGTMVPLMSVGLHTVDIEVQGTHARRLAFDVVVAE